MAQSGGAHGRTVAVLTCPGEIDDPNFPQKCSDLLNRLQKVLENGKSNLLIASFDLCLYLICLFISKLSFTLLTDDVNVVKCEPWNSVKITFDLPAEAAEKLSELAKAGDDVLREMGILSLQIQGGQVRLVTK